MMRTKRLHARLAYVRRLHERLSYVVRDDDRVSVAHVAATLAVRKAVGLCIVVVAVLSAAADAVFVALEVHPATIAGNPKA